MIKCFGLPNNKYNGVGYLKFLINLWYTFKCFGFLNNKYNGVAFEIYIESNCHDLVLTPL